MIPELRIDPEFQKVIPPLDKDELATLTETILKDGEIYFPIITWEGIIIDGHHRYAIVKAHPELKFKIKEIPFENRFEAIAWICKNQLGRRNLSGLQKERLLGLRYNAEKQSRGSQERFDGTKTTNSPYYQNGNMGESEKESVSCTAQRIAEEEGVGMQTVIRAGKFSDGVDIADQIQPGIGDEILSGSIKPTKQAIIAIANASPEDRPQMVADLRKPKESSTGKKGNAIACTPSGRPTSEERKDIRRIVAELVAEKDPVGEDEILVTMDSAFCTMMETCDQLFSQFPGLRTEPKYRNKVIKIIQKPKQYLLKIESEMQ